MQSYILNRIPLNQEYASRMHVCGSTKYPQIINSENNYLQELKHDQKFHEDLRELSSSKYGFRNIPITKLMNLPLDFSSLW